MSDIEKLPDWLIELNKLTGRDNTKPRPAHRPLIPMNEDLLILMRREGHSNRSIARELGFARRTVDRRFGRMARAGKLDGVEKGDLLRGK